MKPGKANKLIIVAVVVVIVAVTMLLLRPARPAYRVTDVGPSVLKAINNNGQVVGWTRPPEPQISFIQDPHNERQEIPNPEGKVCFACDINDKGKVVGYLRDVNSSYCSAFIYDEEGGVTELGTLGGASSFANAINNKDQVAGWAFVRGDMRHAFLWDSAAGMQDLGTLGGKHSQAFAVNDKGQVVGSSRLPDGQTRAFLWEKSTGMIDLGALGPAESCAMSINNLGQVVGHSTSSGKERRACAFVWDAKGGMRELEVSGQDSYAFDICDSGQILGVYYMYGLRLLIPPRLTFFIWDSDRGIIKLGDIPQLKAGDYDPSHMNNKGQIAGTLSFDSGPDHGVILTPKPEQ